MDAFGIDNAVRGAFEVLMTSARRTGRTTAMLESLNDGDRVVFLCKEEANRVARLAREMGREIEVLVLPVEKRSDIFERGSSIGRLIFDHSWIEEYWRQALKQAAHEIDYLQREAGGAGVAHAETRLAAKEAARWGGWHRRAQNGK